MFWMRESIQPIIQPYHSQPKTYGLQTLRLYQMRTCLSTEGRPSPPHGNPTLSCSDQPSTKHVTKHVIKICAEHAATALRALYRHFWWAPCTDVTHSGCGALEARHGGCPARFHDVTARTDDVTVRPNDVTTEHGATALIFSSNGPEANVYAPREDVRPSWNLWATSSLFLANPRSPTVHTNHNPYSLRFTLKKCCLYIPYIYAW